jgi:multidrug efflux system outer membrane protein
MLSGCTMIPDFSRPDFSAAQSWHVVPGYELQTGENLAVEMDWKAFFNSPEFHLVIGTALQNNKDLKTAALNIEEARALYRIERADLFPDVNANGDGTIAQSSDKSSVTGRGQKTELYEANLGIAAYELDLFGKIRSNNESAINEYLATTEARAVVRSALIAETANAYLQLLADQKLLSLTQKTLEAQQRTYDILSQSLEKGVSTEQDVARAATAVETARVNQHQYSRFVAQDKNALFLLMGIAQDNTFLPKTTLDDVAIKDSLDPGLPSEVLLMRPDIRQAEYELMARNADIGAARAAFFPSITLTGTYGFASQSLGDLFASGAGGAWAFLPQITLPIFQAGRNKTNLDLAGIRKEKAVVSYEKAIQTAFREVSDELAARETLDEQLKSQRRLVAAAQKVYDISEVRYKSGIDSFLTVLDSQRELYMFQQNEIQIERQRLANLVNLYKVLGGGSKI